MRQILQSLRDGETFLADVPVPTASGNSVVVQTVATVVSAGTERMLVEFGRASWLEKARSQPDKVRQVLERVRANGLSATLESVRSKLAQPVPLGYCQAGIIVAVGPGAGRFAVGDRVVTNGPHAQFVKVPSTLVARVPEGVTLEAAAFTPLAAIALQGLRLAAPTLGETIVVYGLGLIGLLTVQLARASGCRVIGIDMSAERLALAELAGATAINAADGDLAVTRVLELTGNIGADAVLLTLSTQSDEPVHHAAQMSRKRGRLVLVGVAGLSLSRDDFYRKELSFQVSCSYGPGRYDPTHEEAGIDYPLPFVRWTEGRNFDAVLGLMRDGSVNPLPLVTHRFPLAEAKQAYEVVAGSEPSLAIVLSYGEPTAHELLPSIQRTTRTATGGRTRVGVIGAGNYASRVLIPAFKAAGAVLESVASAGGVSASIAATSHEIGRVVSNARDLLADADIDTVVIATRHDSHAKWVCDALDAGKNVYVEKPLALTLEELERVQHAAMRASGLLCIGFNRRFAPLMLSLKNVIEGRGVPTINILVNSGAIPPDHWAHDGMVGGGRIVGEACHFIDAAQQLANSRIVGIQVSTSRGSDGRPIDDLALIQLRFENSAIASIQYLASGHASFPKERIEVFVGGIVARVDNWRRLEVFGRSGSQRSSRQDKGANALPLAFVRAIHGVGPIPIDLSVQLDVSRWSIIAQQLAHDGGGSVSDEASTA